MFVCFFPFFFFFLSVSFFLSVFYAYQFDSSLCMDIECNITLFSRYCFFFITINLLRILLYCNDKNATIKCTNLLQLGEELYKQYASVPILFTFV